MTVAACYRLVGPIFGVYWCYSILCAASGRCCGAEGLPVQPEQHMVFICLYGAEQHMVSPAIFVGKTVYLSAYCTPTADQAWLRTETGAAVTTLPAVRIVLTCCCGSNTSAPYRRTMQRLHCVLGNAELGNCVCCMIMVG